MSTKPLVVERTFDARANSIWHALTDIEQIKKWYFQLEDFKPKIGFKFDFMGGEEGGQQFLHLCEVTQVEEGKKLAYTWRYDNYPGNSEVVWELLDKGEQTFVKVTHHGLESFSDNGPMFQKESFQGGWHYFLYEALKNYLEK